MRTQASHRGSQQSPGAGQAKSHLSKLPGLLQGKIGPDKYGTPAGRHVPATAQPIQQEGLWTLTPPPAASGRPRDEDLQFGLFRPRLGAACAFRWSHSGDCPDEIEIDSHLSYTGGGSRETHVSPRLPYHERAPETTSDRSQSPYLSHQEADYHSHEHRKRSSERRPLNGPRFLVNGIDRR